MKKLFIFLFFVVFSLLTSAFATDDLYSIDEPPNLTFNVKNIKPQFVPKNGESSEVIPKTNKTVNINQNTNSKKRGFFSKFFNKQNKQKAEFDPITGGYKGSIPDINSEYGYKQQKSTSIKDDRKNAEEFTPDEFEQSKIDDPLFLDVILNKEKASSYAVDMLRVMKFLESFRVIVQNHDNLQKFNANVNVLDLHARRIEKLYSDKPEGMSESYWMLLDLAYKAKVLGNLKFDANYYSKFSPVTGTQYDPQNIINEDDKLLIDLDKTVFAIRQLNN